MLTWVTRSCNIRGEQLYQNKNTRENNVLEPILVCGNIEKTFLQIRIQESERDVLRFH